MPTNSKTFSRLWKPWANLGRPNGPLPLLAH
jgi:hypothetical protein